jgi:hypothetical protein
MSWINFLMSADSFGRPPGDFDLPSPVQTKARAVPTDYSFGPSDCQGAQDVRRQAIQSRKYQPIDGAECGRFRDLRRRTFSWWRSTRISASSEVRDRKSPISAHQSSLQSSIIEQKIHPIRCLWPTVWGFR